MTTSVEDLPSTPSSGHPMDPIARFRIGLAGITVSALALRITYVLTARRDFPLKGDDFFYHWQARAIADGLGFIDPFAWKALGRMVATAAHPPLYSLYLTAASVLGIDTPLGHRLASCVLGALAVAVIGLVACRIATRRAGLLAAGVAAMYPSLWINDGMLTSETLYILLIAGVLLAAYAYIETPTLPRAGALGAVIGLAALTRPEAIMLVPLMGVMLLLDSRRQRRATPNDRSPDAGWAAAGLRSAGVLGIAAMAVVSPWLARNLTTFDKPVLLASGHGTVLAAANCDAAYHGPFLGYWDIGCITSKNPPANAEQRRILEGKSAPGLAYLLAQGNRDESIADQNRREVAFEYIGENLGRAPLVALARAGRVWNVFRPLQGVDFDVFFERRGLWPSRAALASFYVLAGLSCWMLVAMRRRRERIWPFATILVMTTFTAAVSIGITRYRVGGDVVLAILGGVALDQVWSRFRIRRG